jgi:hypothetical protein
VLRVQVAGCGGSVGSGSESAGVSASAPFAATVGKLAKAEKVQKEARDVVSCERYALDKLKRGE